MIIVSQDKLRITENLELMIYPVYYDIDKLKIKCYKIQNDLTWLGYYKSEERAKEVLRDIIHEYRTDKNVYEMPKE